MILNQKQTTLAYRCPHCGSAVTSLIGVFSLSADMIRMKCPCGGSDLSVVYTKDKKVRLQIPCFLCPKPHTFTISSQLFFETDLMAFPCPYSGINIGFVGNKESVDRAFEDANRELESILGEEDFSSLSDNRHNRADMFSDPQIMDIIMYVIHELNAEGEIRCKCPEGHGHYAVDILDEGVKISCEDCGASTLIPTDSIVSANAFLHCTHIDLE
jgi:hypothetical protein